MTAPQEPMSADEYAVAQAAISAALILFVAQFAKYFANPALAPADWLNLLRLIYPEVAEAREKSATLAREFYDTQRAAAHPDLPVLARDIEPYQFEWFVAAMEPARESFSREQASEQAVGRLAAVAVREVENAGRRQIINAVKYDKPLAEKIERQRQDADLSKAQVAELQSLLKPDPVKRERKTPKLTPEQVAEFQALLNPDAPQTRTTWAGGKTEVTPKAVRAVTEVRGWARVATGRETCAFCLMLISRGPVYFGADTAGLQLPDDEVAAMFKQSDLANYFEDISDFMEEWHTNCDCKVVPVFDLKNWVGRDEAANALRLWRKAGEKANEVLAENPDKKYYSHTEKEWLPTTLNRETINQLRQMLASGDVADWAALHAA